MDKAQVSFTARIERKEAFLPRYIVVAAGHVGGRKAAFAADVMLNGAGPFRRTIHPWGKGLDQFFFNLTAPQCAKAGLDTDDSCMVTLTSLG